MPGTTTAGDHPSAGAVTSPTASPATTSEPVCTTHTASAPEREAPRPTRTTTTPAACAMPAGTYFAGWVR